VWHLPAYPCIHDEPSIGLEGQKDVQEEKAHRHLDLGPLDDLVAIGGPCVGTLGLPTGAGLGLDVDDSVVPPAPGNAQGALPARAGRWLLIRRIGGEGTIGMAGALWHASVERGDPHGLWLDNGEQMDAPWAHDEWGLCPTGGIQWRRWWK
jgi:hypothetical protein